MDPVGKLKALVTFNGKWLYMTVDKEQTHVDDDGDGLQ